MPKLATQLTDVQVRKAEPRLKPYKLGDGGGLYLYIKPTGKRFWRMKYDRDGKEATLSIGAFPDISLSAARLECANARKLLAKGIDPVDVKREFTRQARATKPITARFRLSMNAAGELTIEKPTTRIRLNAAQVEALLTFLLAAAEK